MAVNKSNPKLRNPSTFLPLTQISHNIYIYMESKAGIRKSHWFPLSPLQNSL
ncbi:unnamed protein product [Brassica oleracea var. botrytis]